MFTHEIRVQRSKVPYIIGACVVALLAVLMLVPFPHPVRAGFALECTDLSEVKAPRAGTIEKVSANEGDTTEAAKPLARLDGAELEKKVKELSDTLAIDQRKREGAIARNRNAAKAQSELQKAQAAAKAASSALEAETQKAAGKETPKLAAAKKKAEAAGAAGEKAQKAFDAAVPKTPELDAEVKKVEEDLASAKADLAKSSIDAPRAGLIASLSLKPGQKVAAGEVVAKVGDLTPLKVLLAPKKPAELKPGQAVELLFPEGPVHATLVSAGKDSAEARIDNKDGKIKLSTEGEAIITAEPQPLIHFR